MDNLNTKPVFIDTKPIDESVARGRTFLNALATTATSEVRATPEVRATTTKDAKACLEDTLARLKALHPLHYEQIRQQEAKRLKVRVSVLDKYVLPKNESPFPEEQESDAPFPLPEMWQDEVAPENILDTIYHLIKRHIVCDEETVVAASLWIVFTWFIDVVRVAPIAHITAPEKRCGKTQLLDLLGKLCRKPWLTSSLTPATLYRMIEKHRPTALIDEADAFIRENEALRGILDCGHTRTAAFVWRVDVDANDLVQYNVWGAKAIAGIGKLPDTIKDRSIPFMLRRKLPTEPVLKLRDADPMVFEHLCSKLARFSYDNEHLIAASRPPIPVELNDRDGDNWEPLLSIADLAGERWATMARNTAIKLCGYQPEHADDSVGVELLTDIKEVFDAKGVTRMSTTDLIKALCADETKRWATFNKGNAMTPRQLAVRLKAFGIVVTAVSIANEKYKGYKRESFEDAFHRYVVGGM